jgi:hypothetical protein
VTTTVPPPVALKPMPLVVVMSRPLPPALKLTVAPVLLVRLTPFPVVLAIVVWPVKLIVLVPVLLLATRMPPPASAPSVMLPEIATVPPVRFWI